jgi:hypothetical protein
MIPHQRDPVTLAARFIEKLFCRPDTFSRNSYVDDNSCFLVSSLPHLFYTLS